MVREVGDSGRQPEVGEEVGEELGRKAIVESEMPATLSLGCSSPAPYRALFKQSSWKADTGW